MMIWYTRENAHRDRVVREAGVDDITEDQKRLERELADDVSWFRYTV